MRIINRSTFMSMPAGTAFQKGKPWCWGGLCFKGDTIYSDAGEAIDWFYSSIDEPDAFGDVHEAYRSMYEAGTSLPVTDILMRDGCFDDGDLFLIYEADDLKGIVSRIEAGFDGLAMASRV